MYRDPLAVPIEACQNTCLALAQCVYWVGEVEASAPHRCQISFLKTVGRCAIKQIILCNNTFISFKVKHSNIRQAYAPAYKTLHIGLMKCQ